MPRVAVYPVSPLPELGFGQGSSERGGGGSKPSILDRASAATPATWAQALMEAGPFVEPVLSKEELLPIMDLVVEALDVLDERERWIVYGRIWRRKSVRRMAHELALSKTHLDRIYKGALAKLADELRASGASSDIASVLGRVDL